MNKFFNNPFIGFVSVLMFFAVGCKKDHTDAIETSPGIIYPMPYFPVYPGSWWTYVNGFGDSVQTTMIGDYQEYSYSDITRNGAQSDVVKIPFWNSYPMYGYSYPRKVNLDDNGLTLIPLLSEQTGDHWIKANYNGDINFSETIATDTSIEVEGIIYNHVIQINDYFESIHDSIPKTLINENYYAKDVGLIRILSYPNDPFGGMHLKSYFINH